MKLTFWGAAATVTGSAHLVEADGKRYLLDFGTYQGRRKDADARNRDLPVPAASSPRWFSRMPISTTAAICRTW